MENDVPELHETHYLFASCLLSKWGFSHGGLFSWVMELVPVNHHQVLIETVKAELLPKLSQKVTVEEVVTAHNPIRALTVDGMDVTEWHYSALECPIKFSPEYVTVTGEAVLDLARRLAGAH